MQTASIAHVYALQSASSPMEVFDAIRSAIAHAGEACPDYLRLELALPVEEDSTVPTTLDQSLDARDWMVQSPWVLRTRSYVQEALEMVLIERKLLADSFYE